ncbi:MAG: hypothetical protein IKP00_14315 [Victivallales bacterium]|nr:hypothetical protein [Victivallales bacterium]
MKKLLLFCLLIATIACFASESAYKALFGKDTNILVKGDAAAWEKFAKDNKLEDMFSFMKNQNELSDISTSLQKKLEEKLKDNKVQNVFISATVTKDDILGALDAKSAKGVFFLAELEAPLTIDLLLEIVNEVDKKEEIEAKRADIDGFPAMQVKAKEDEVVIALVDSGKSIVASKVEDMKTYLERYKSGTGVGVSAKLAEVIAAGNAGHLVISFAMPDGLDKYLGENAEKSRESDPMNATFMDTGAKLQGVSIGVNANGSNLDVKLGFLMNTPEDAIQLKAFIFEGMLKPMLSMLMDSQGKPYSFVQKLTFGCENRCATATTSITIDEIAGFAKNLAAFRP